MCPRDPIQHGDDFHSNVAEQRWFGAIDSVAPRQVAKESHAARFAMAHGLRLLPEVATRALQLLRTPPLRAAELRTLIESDLVLTTKVMKYANTAFRKGDVGVATVKQAMKHLGDRMVPGLVASVATEAPFPDVDGTARDIQLHSLGVAAIVHLLATRYQVPDVEELVLCGLLHDIGRLMLLQCDKPGRGTAAPLLAGDEQPDEEYAQLGFDHAVLGSHVLSRWGFPERVHRIVASHHEEGRLFLKCGELARRTCWLRIADRLEPLVRQHETFDLNRAMGVLDDPYARYIDFDPGDLEENWPRIVNVRQVALAAFPRRPDGGSGG